MQPMPKPTVFPILKSGPTTKKNEPNTSPMALVSAARILLKSSLLEATKIFTSNLGISAFINRLEVISLVDNEAHPLFAKLKDKGLRAL